MIIKNFLLYFSKKKIKNCIKCNSCIFVCPKNKIKTKKKFLIKNCKLCNFCKIKCLINSIK